MIEFEQQVADALKTQIDSTQGDPIYEAAFVDRIAPRVAAAIEAARHPARLSKPDDSGPHFGTAREAENYAILRALREPA